MRKGSFKKLLLLQQHRASKNLAKVFLSVLLVLTIIWTGFECWHALGFQNYGMKALALQCGKPQVSNAAEVRALLVREIFENRSPMDPNMLPPPQISKATAELHNRFWRRDEDVSGTENEEGIYERLLKEVKPQVVIQIGTFLGESLIHMAKLADHILEKQPLFLGLDEFRGSPFVPQWESHKLKWKGFAHDMILHQFIYNVASANLSERVFALPFAPIASMQQLCDMGVVAGLVELDPAQHDFLSMWMHLSLAWSLVDRSRGVIFGRDMVGIWPAVPHAVRLFASKHNLRLKKIKGGFWVLRRHTFL